MANGVQAGSSVAAGLEGLIGGFLMAQDFKRGRREEAAETDERRRLQERQAVLDAQNAESLARQRSIEDLNLATQHGLEFAPGSPGGLARGVGERLSAAGDPLSHTLGAAPAGFRRVGPSAEQRENERLTRLRSGVGGFLAADPDERARMFEDPEIVAGLAELGILDEAAGSRFEAGAPELPFSVNVGGISTKVATPGEALSARDRFAPPPAPEPDKSFDQINALADDFFREAQIPMDVAAAVTRARAAGDNAVGDQTKIIALNKLLDPGSIVREGEFNRVGQAGGLEARAQFYYNQMRDGRLPSTLAEALAAEIEAQAAVAAEAFQPTLARFTQRAQAFGLPPEQIVFDPFSKGGGMFDDLIPGN